MKLFRIYSADTTNKPAQVLVESTGQYPKTLIRLTSPELAKSIAQLLEEAYQAGRMDERQETDE